MSFQRRRLGCWLVLAAVAVAFTYLPAAPARADGARPPFEIRFPQETQVTEIHNDFGAHRPGGRRHTGNDLMAPKMTQVYAFADGVIETVGTSRRAGRYVVISHAAGWSSTYIHLNNDNPETDDGKADWSLTVAPGIEEGVAVSAGDLIGWVGDSGNAEWTGSHTHFELAIDGRPIDPNPLLVEAWERDHDVYVMTVVAELYPDGLGPIEPASSSPATVVSSSS